MDINKLSLAEKIGQMLCFAFHGLEYNHQLKVLIEDNHIGNIIHFARNIESAKQVKVLNATMQKHAKYPLFISLDHEGGMVRRVLTDIHYLPGAMALAATNKDIYDEVALTNLELRQLGFNINHAPVADVNNNPSNPVINSRSYSDNPDVVSKYVTSAVLGMQRVGMLPTVKHFPGHGDTNVDSHIGLPVVRKSITALNNLELKPFKAAIACGADGIMISHILFPSLDEKYPASLSYNIITKLLKQELGFKGLIMTDSLTMGAIWQQYSISEIIVQAINAGNDIIVFCGQADLKQQINIINTFTELVNCGKISLERINESVSKIINLKAKYQSISFSDIILINDDLCAASITKAFDDNHLLPLRPHEKILSLFPKISLASLVDNHKQMPITLGQFLGCDEIVYDEQYLIKNIVQNQDKYDKIVLGTYNIKADDYQVKLAAVLDKNKTIFISLRSPYDLQYIGGIKSYICTYDVTKESLSALANLLYTDNFRGKLPIKIRR